jgi:ribosomal-protein-alanine N-acetyltransferase
MLFRALATERLNLRELLPSDAAEIFRLRSDDRVNAFVERQRAITLDDAKNFIQRISSLSGNNEAVMWALTFKEDTKLIGTIVFWHIEPDKAKAEVGYELLPEYHGKGIMSESLKKVIEFGFDELKFKTITAEPHPRNLPSIKLLERLGFTLTGKSEGGYLAYEMRT